MKALLLLALFVFTSCDLFNEKPTPKTTTETLVVELYYGSSSFTAMPKVEFLSNDYIIKTDYFPKSTIGAYGYKSVTVSYSGYISFSHKVYFYNGFNTLLDIDSSLFYGLTNTVFP